MYIYFYRTGLAPSEYNFTFNFCCVVIGKFGLKVRLIYGPETGSLILLYIMRELTLQKIILIIDLSLNFGI